MNTMANESETPMHEDARLTIRLTARDLWLMAIDKSAEYGIRHERFDLKPGFSPTAEIRDCLQNSTLMCNNYRKAQLLVDAPVMLTPIEEYHGQDHKALFVRTFRPEQRETIVKHIIPDLNVIAFFTLRTEVQTLLSERFDELRIIPLMRTTWSRMHKKSLMGNRKKLYAYFHEDKLEVFAFEKSRFKYHNSFEKISSADAVYFMLHVWKTIGLDNNEDEMYLLGILPDEERIKSQLERYLRKVYVLHTAADFHRAPMTGIKGIPYDMVTLFVKNR